MHVDIQRQRERVTMPGIRLVGPMARRRAAANLSVRLRCFFGALMVVGLAARTHVRSLVLYLVYVHYPRSSALLIGHGGTQRNWAEQSVTAHGGAKMVGSSRMHVVATHNWQLNQTLLSVS